MPFMDKIGKGFLYGIMFFFAGYTLFHHQNFFRGLVPSLSDLPVIVNLDNFKTGVELAGQDFATLLEKGWNHSNVRRSLSQPHTAWAWQRSAIEAKLHDHFGARQAAQRQRFLDYIEQYAPLALSEMAQSRIPASVTLAQGILETNAGDSYIARAANNHFGIKCYKRPDYKADGIIDDRDFYHHQLAYGCLQMKDDHVWDRFHKYHTVEHSYRHHTLLLTQESRYNWMIREYGHLVGQYCQVEPHWLGRDTVPYYAAWCIGLKKSGYATSPQYARKLTYIIQTYELWRFDYQLIMSNNNS